MERLARSTPDPNGRMSACRISDRFGMSEGGRETPVRFELAARTSRRRRPHDVSRKRAGLGRCRRPGTNRFRTSAVVAGRTSSDGRWRIRRPGRRREQSTCRRPVPADRFRAAARTRRRRHDCRCSRDGRGQALHVAPAVRSALGQVERSDRTLRTRGRGLVRSRDRTVRRSLCRRSMPDGRSAWDHRAGPGLGATVAAAGRPSRGRTGGRPRMVRPSRRGLHDGGGVGTRGGGSQPAVW